MCSITLGHAAVRGTLAGALAPVEPPPVIERGRLHSSAGIASSGGARVYRDASNKKDGVMLRHHRLFLLLGLILVGGCEQAHGTEEPASKAHATQGHGAEGASPGGHGGHGQPVFPVSRPLRQDAEIFDEYVAQIRASQHIELRALERGYLTEIHVDEGQRVEKGAKMFQILPRILDAELGKAKAELDLAAIEYQNTETLAQKGIVAPAELAMAKARLAKTKAERALAATHRDLTEIRAPFTGLMGRFGVRLGSLVDEGDLLTTLSDNSTVWVYFNVPEAEYLDFQTSGDASARRNVHLRMANGKRYALDGTVETIVADFNHETGNIAFRAAFPNPNGLLRHGETGNVMIRRAFPQALLVPQSATFETLDRRYVFVVDAEGVVKQHQIQVAAELPHVFVVAEGVAETDLILLEGLRKVVDGQQITVRQLEPAKVFAELEPHAE
jgi:membrane fusion protein (multidrug efflux system)